MHHGVNDTCFVLRKQKDNTYTAERIDRGRTQFGDIPLKRSLMRRLRTRNGKGFLRIKRSELRISGGVVKTIKLPQDNAEAE